MRKIKKKTHEEYVEELKIKNPTVEVVAQFINVGTPITHHCLIHDIYWEAYPTSILRGAGCEKCHKERQSRAKLMTHNEYVERLRSVSPYIIPLEEYVNARTNIRHLCTLHDHIWNATPQHLLSGHGCPKCRIATNIEKQRKTTKEYIEELKNINPDIEVVDEYLGAKVPIKHKCKIDGNIWYSAPNNILFGRGCPVCQESSGERQIRQWLDSEQIPYIPQKRFEDCKDTNTLPFDFYLTDLNMVIEYDGGQHFFSVDYFGGDKAFKKRVKHDQIKNEYCKNNGIEILRIPYYQDVKETLDNYFKVA